MTIGKRIRSERERRGWSQGTLGDKLGRSKHVISLWESDTHRPGIADRVILSRILLIPFHELLPEADGNVVAVTADPALRQVVMLWPEIDEPLREVVLMLCVKLRDRSADTLSESLTEQAG